MIVYLDSSVILRKVLGQGVPLSEWGAIESAVASALVEVECLRTLDRLRISDAIADREVAARRESVYRLLDSVEVVEPTRAILIRAAQPMPTALGTLDAIHLATALVWREKAPELVMATHDAALALASRASGMATIGG